MRRLDEALRTANWIAEQVKEHWPDAVVNLGDTFESHSTIDTPSLCVGIRAMDTIARACKACAARFATIPGNHDAYSKDYSALEIFKGLGVDIVWEPTVYDDVFGAMPFTKNIKQATEWLHDLDARSQAVLVHIDVKGSQTFSGYVSDVGVDADEFDGPIYGGHLHHPHTIGSIDFIGSVMHHNFSDREIVGKPRGILLVDIEEDGTVSEERIANPHTTVYHKADWTKKKSVLDTIKLYGRYQGRLHLRAKCFVGDVNSVKGELQERFPKLLSASVIGISPHSGEVKRTASVKVDTDPGEALEAYVKNKGVPKGLDGDKLLATGKELLDVSI